MLLLEHLINKHLLIEELKEQKIQENQLIIILNKTILGFFFCFPPDKIFILFQNIILIIH